MKLSVVIAFAIAVSTFNANAGAKVDYAQLASAALENLDNIKSEDFSYTKTDTSEGNIDVSIFDPGKADGQQWQLISKDGAQPSQKQLKKFNKQMNARDDDDQVREIDLSDMVARSSVTFISQQGDLARYSFVPMIEDLADEHDKLAGELTIAITKQQITNMVVTNTEELSPAFSVTIKEFRLAFEFSEADNRAVMAKITTKISGKVGFFKSLDQDSTRQFSDYHYVGS